MGATLQASMAASMASMAGQPISMAQAVMAGAGQGIMVQGENGQLLQQQLLMAPRQGIPPGMMLGRGMQLGAMPAIPGMQMGLPGAMGGLVSSQPQLFARPPKAEIDDIFGEFEIDEDYMIKTKDVIGLFVSVKEEPKV